MPLTILDSAATPRKIKRLSVMDQTNTLRLIKTLTINDDTNAPQVVFQFYAASSSPDTVAGVGASNTPVTIVTMSTTVTVEGGTSPFTYLWSRVNPMDTFWQIVNPTSATTNFRALTVPSGVTLNATFQCSVTDSTSAVIQTNIVAASAFNVGA